MDKSGKHEVTKDQFFQLYLDDRKFLLDAAREAARTFDKAMLTFTSGAFIVSIAFLKDVVPTPFLNTLWLLGYSWFFFSVAIVLILFGFLASQNACNAQIDITYSELMNEKKKTNYWTIITTFCNYASLVVLMTAFVFSGCFVYWNKIHSV
jgi:hypothetical protein